MPYDVYYTIYGIGDGTRRNDWVMWWIRSSDIIRKSEAVVVAPKAMEDFFYNLCSKEMIVEWDSAAYFDVRTFTLRIMKESFTRTFLLWFEGLFPQSKSDTKQDNRNVKMLVLESVTKMVTKIVNTKLKAIRLHENAKKITDSEFRDARRHDAFIKQEKKETKNNTSLKKKKKA